MNRGELFRQAKRVVELRRQQADAAALQRKQELYAAVPELARLDAQQNTLGAEAARLAADGLGAEARAKLDESRAATREKEKILAGLGHRAGELLPRYSCKLCGDTGLVDSGTGKQTCQCVLAELKKLRREQINQSGPLSPCRFESFVLDYYPEQGENGGASPRRSMEQVLDDCRYYAEHFGPASDSIYMFGDAGLGKTHLALSIAGVVLDKGYDVIYVSSQQAFSTISAQRFSGDELFGSMLEADLLILDDLGSEYVDAFVLSKLYELINTRLRRPTIYTTNVCKAELLEQRYTEKISSRLLGECHIMPFSGQDIRLLKRR